ncbi:MAG: tetratricopeptide repeat protein [Bryobacterales bacterium]|nr:tetratricopeptide repeat protein [Bryobacterales bacterium]
MDQEASPSRSSLKTLLADSQSQSLSEQWLKNAWHFVQAKAHHHLVEQPLLGEMGQSALLIFAALFLLSTASGVLNGRYWAMRESLAHEEFERARGLNAQGQHEQALRRLRAAFHLEHHNREYQMALTLTLIELERYDEARLQLDDILKADPTNAPANLLLARIAASEGSAAMDTAVQYFQRAVYGLWPSEPIRNRIDARFELANFLAAEQRIEELRAELIVLATDIRDNLDQLLRVGYLMLYARAPDQAEIVFTRALGQEPRNADALAGLGKAQLETGNFAASEQALLRANRANPGNEEIRKQLDLVQQIRALNPKRRGLGIYLSARRALQLLTLTHDRLAACAEPESLPPEAREDLASATKELETKRRGAPTMEQVDADISLSIRLYHHGSDFCGKPQENPALERLLLALTTEQ